MPNFIGYRFGRLTVVSRHPYIRNGWHCQCDCGNTHVARRHHLMAGDTQSCGCLLAEGNRLQHGHSRHGQTTSLYIRWHAMITRCTNPADAGYKNYGGRGITICDRWRKFENFLADMGEPPLGLTLDRIDNDGNYEPGNCRWATASEQRSNQRPRSKPTN